MSRKILQTHGPTHLTILPTYRCTAACKQCCFESRPDLRGRIPIARVLSYIDEAASSFPTLRLVVFSGGECFLLGKDLDRAVARATLRGLATRCVTNGYWATTERVARRRMGALYEAGLAELNFSTGDEHQYFVPFERVVKGALVAAEHGIRTAIVIEGCNESTFKLEDALRHPDLSAFLQTGTGRQNLEVMTNVWIPFRETAAVSQPEEVCRGRQTLSRGSGCENILENVAITPHEQLASCCGLTFEHIDEMKLGDLRTFSMKELYERQLDDFIKLWIRVEGPERIFHFATRKDPEIPYPECLTHPCQACAGLFLNPRVRRALQTHYLEKVPEILFRYQISHELGRAAKADSAHPPSVESEHLGFGA